MDNDVYVRQIDSDTVRVWGYNHATRQYTTKINGLDFDDFQVTGDDLWVDLYAGNDRIRVDDMDFRTYWHSEINIDTGHGNDTVLLGGSGGGPEIRIHPRLRRL